MLEKNNKGKIGFYAFTKFCNNMVRSGPEDSLLALYKLRSECCSVCSPAGTYPPFRIYIMTCLSVLWSTGLTFETKREYAPCYYYAAVTN
jgi:hypothetical protein